MSSPSTKDTPPGFNDSTVNSWMRNVATDLIGSDRVEDQAGGMGAEDFSYMSKMVPGAMFNLGAKVPGGGNHHTPLFDIDENVLPQGSAILAETARRYVTGKFKG